MFIDSRDGAHALIVPAIQGLLWRSHLFHFSLSRHHFATVQARQEIAFHFAEEDNLLLALLLLDAFFNGSNFTGLKQLQGSIEKNIHVVRFESKFRNMNDAESIKNQYTVELSLKTGFRRTFSH